MADLMIVGNGFRALPVLAKDSDPSSEALHGPLRYMYMREHEDRTLNEEDQGKTLFVANIPTGTSDTDIKKFFNKLGTVNQATTSQMGTTRSKTTHVQFTSRKALQKCGQMNLKKDRGMHMLGANLKRNQRTRGSMAVDRWLGMYARGHPDAGDLRAECEELIASYDDEMSAKEAKAKETHNVVDDDGWVTVQASGDRRGRHSDGTDLTVHTASAKGIEKAQKNNKTSKTVVDFYRFQQRDQKRTQIANLRRKFDQDKQKLQRMRQTRRFNPLPQ